MLFDTSRSNVFVPELNIAGVRLEVVEQMKLLGVIISNDLRILFITQKAYSRLWVLRKLTRQGASKDTLLDVYEKQVRSVLEFAAVVWTAGLSRKNILYIERVQKSALQSWTCEICSLRTVSKVISKWINHFQMPLT